MVRLILILFFILISSTTSLSQSRDTVITFPYGKLDHWVKRSVTDSKIIGKKCHEMYEIGVGKKHLEICELGGEEANHDMCVITVEEELPNNIPFIKMKSVPWRTSNVMANVGVRKGSHSLTREKRGDGYCARLETVLEKIKVLGMFNINIIATGSLYLGDTHEPISSIKNAIRHVSRGIEMNQSPDKIIFDYKYHSANERYYANGLSAPKIQEGVDVGEVLVFLQKRWEDEKGNIYAKRLATAICQMPDTEKEWINDFELNLTYGDISNTEQYVPIVNLFNKDTKTEFRHYATNSKGDQKQIIEIGWGDKNDIPTHLFISFCSSSSGAFVGAPGSVLWIDNIRMGLSK